MSIIIKIINFIESKIEFSKFCSYGTTLFTTLDNTTELWMTKYIIREFFSSGGATLYKMPSDQTETFCTIFSYLTQFELICMPQSGSKQYMRVIIHHKQ